MYAPRDIRSQTVEFCWLFTPERELCRPQVFLACGPPACLTLARSSLRHASTSLSIYKSSSYFWSSVATVNQGTELFLMPAPSLRFFLSLFPIGDIGPLSKTSSTSKFYSGNLHSCHCLNFYFLRNEREGI